MDQAQVSARLVAKVVLVIAGVVAALYLAYLIREVIGLFLIAVFFAVAIAPAVNGLDTAAFRAEAFGVSGATECFNRYAGRREECRLPHRIWRKGG